MHYKTCEICGLRSGRVLDNKRIFMAKFPLDEGRCKKWVKVTGNEDLANIPIEKLHQLKHICGDHFRPKDFKKKKTQLKKTAVPSLRITAKPLSDELLMGFPLHIHPSRSSNIGAGNSNVSGDQSKQTVELKKLWNQTSVNIHIKNVISLSDHSKNETAVSDHSKNETAVNMHIKNETDLSDHSKNETAVSYHSKNQTAVGDHSKKKTALSDHSKNETAVNIHIKNETDLSDHSKNETAVSNHSKNQTAVSDHSKNETAVNIHIKSETDFSDHSKNETAVSNHSKNVSAVSNHSKNQTAVSDLSKNQAAVNIKIEDAVDESKYLAAVDDTEVDDDCYTISDDDCVPVVDDDSSFYHNVSKRSDEKEGEPQNDKNEDLHDGFKCNSCAGEIKGYRYTCVQCPDYDLCGSCEARGAHCLHYVLRIPRPKPYAEIQPLLREIRRLLSGANTDVLWKQPDEIKKEELNDVVDIDCVTPTLSEMVDNVPEITTLTSVKMSHGNRLDNKDNVPEVTMQPSIVNTRTTVCESSQYTASTRLAPHGNTVLTIESSPQVIDKTRTPVSASSPVLARLVHQRNERPLLTSESSLQTIDKTRTPASESSLFTASSSVSSDGNTVLTIATNVEDTDSTSRPVPSTSRLYASSSITAAGTETISNKIKITGDPHLKVPMATKRKCSDNTEASKHKVALLKESEKIAVPKDIGPGTRFKIIKKPSAAEQPQDQGTVYAARHRTRSTQREQDAPR